MKIYLIALAGNRNALVWGWQSSGHSFDAVVPPALPSWCGSAGKSYQVWIFRCSVTIVSDCINIEKVWACDSLYLDAGSRWLADFYTSTLIWKPGIIYLVDG